MFYPVESKRARSLLSLAIVLANAPVLAMAADQKVEEVIVTGEKIERSLQDTVSSVGVYTAAQIEAAPIYDINDIFDRLANVNGAQGNEGFTIRGINNRAVAASGSSGLASYHIDGAFISSFGIRVGQKDVWDVKQVEVFRGPQSTNQGRNSLAGAVFVRTNDPSYTPEGRYRIAYGTDNTRAVSFVYSNALIEDQLAFRIAIDDQHSDGYVDNEILNDDQADSSNTTIRAKLLFEPEAIEGLSVLTTLSHSKNESGDGFVSLQDENGAPISPYAHKAYSNIEGFEDFDQSIAVIEADYDINDVWTLTNAFTWNDGERRRQDDSDRQPSGGDALRVRDNDIRTISNELRLNFNTQQAQGNIGLYYFQQESNEDINDVIDQTIRPTIIALVPDVNPALAPFAQTIANLYDEPLYINRQGSRDRDIDNWAVFGNVDYQLTEFVELFAGARYDNEKVKNVSSEARSLASELPDPATLPFPLNSATSTVNALILSTIEANDLDNEGDYSAFLPKAGVTLHWTDDLNTSFSIQRSYRAGGAGTSSFGTFEFDPEFATNYDFSLRSQWFDQRLTVNANLFYIDWKDQQIQVVEPIARAEFVTINAGKSTVKGAELEMSVRPSDNFDAYFNLGYTDTEFTEFPDTVTVGSTTFVGDDFEGNSFNDAPKLTASAGFAYDITHDLTWQFDINYQDESYSNSDNTLKNDSRTVFNSKLNYRITDNIELGLVARNLLDEEYITFNDVSADNTVNVGQPRTLLLQMQGSF